MTQTRQWHPRPPTAVFPCWLISGQSLLIDHYTLSKPILTPRAWNLGLLACTPPGGTGRMELSGSVTHTPTEVIKWSNPILCMGHRRPKIKNVEGTQIWPLNPSRHSPSNSHYTLIGSGMQEEPLCYSCFKETHGEAANTTYLISFAWVCVGYTHNVYANTVCLEPAILSLPSLPLPPECTISWKPHLRLLIGMGRGPTYVLKFITLACEFLNHASCNKLQCLAERYKIFMFGPNDIFPGFYN